MRNFSDIPDLKKIQTPLCPVVDSYLDVYPESDDIEYCNDALINTQYGLVLSKESIIKNSLTEYIWWVPRFGIYSKIEKCANKEEVIKREDSALLVFSQINDSEIDSLPKDILYVSLLHPHGRYSFGHLFDTLQKIITLIKSSYKERNICFLLSKTYQVVDFNLYLELLASDLKYTVRDQNNFKFLKCEELLILKPPAQPVMMHSTEYFNFIFNKFYNYYKDTTPSKQISKKLFLTRRIGQTRCILNQDELHNKLEENGITIIDGTESMLDIFHAFYNATHICCYHGSLLTNHIFCNDNTIIFEYCSNKRVDTSIISRYSKPSERYQKLIETDEKNNAVLDIEEVLSFYTI